MNSQAPIDNVSGKESRIWMVLNKIYWELLAILVYKAWKLHSPIEKKR